MHTHQKGVVALPSLLLSKGEWHTAKHLCDLGEPSSVVGDGTRGFAHAKQPIAWALPTIQGQLFGSSSEERADDYFQSARKDK